MEYIDGALLAQTFRDNLDIIFNKKHNYSNLTDADGTPLPDILKSGKTPDFIGQIRASYGLVPLVAQMQIPIIPREKDITVGSFMDYIEKVSLEIYNNITTVDYLNIGSFQDGDFRWIGRVNHNGGNTLRQMKHAINAIRLLFVFNQDNFHRIFNIDNRPFQVVIMTIMAAMMRSICRVDEQGSAGNLFKVGLKPFRRIYGSYLYSIGMGSATTTYAIVSSLLLKSMFQNMPTLTTFLTHNPVGRSAYNVKLADIIAVSNMSYFSGEIEKYYLNGKLNNIEKMTCIFGFFSAFGHYLDHCRLGAWLSSEDGLNTGLFDPGNQKNTFHVMEQIILKSPLVTNYDELIQTRAYIQSYFSNAVNRTLIKSMYTYEGGEWTNSRFQSVNRFQQLEFIRRSTTGEAETGYRHICNGYIAPYQSNNIGSIRLYASHFTGKFNYWYKAYDLRYDTRLLYNVIIGKNCHAD